MSEIENKTDNIRSRAKQALQTVLTSEKNIDLIEKTVYKLSQNNVSRDQEFSESTYTRNIYQIIGLLLSTNKDMGKIGKVLKEQKIGWKAPIFDNVSRKLEEYDDYLVKPFEVVEGVTECGKCHSKKTWNVQKQTRGGDEPMTTFSRCVQCGHQWSYAG